MRWTSSSLLTPGAVLGFAALFSCWEFAQGWAGECVSLRQAVLTASTSRPGTPVWMTSWLSSPSISISP